MYPRGIRQQKHQRKREQRQPRECRDSLGSRQSGAKEKEMDDDSPVGVIGPEEIAILVHDEQLGRYLRCERPFPLRHDRLIGADDADPRIAMSTKLCVEPRSSFFSLIIGDLVDSRRDSYQTRAALPHST